MTLDKKGSNFYSFSIDKYNPESNLARKRFEDIQNNLKKFLKKSQKGIDLGTGCGLFPFLLEKEGYLIDGIDFNKKYLLIAKKYKEKTNSKCSFFKGDLKKIKLNQQYDYALFLGNTLPHFDINELDEIIKNSNTFLKKDSLFIFDYNDWIRLFLNNYPFEFIEKREPEIKSYHKKFSGEKGALYREFITPKKKFTLKLTVWSPFILDYVMKQNGFNKLKHINTKNNKYLSIYKKK